MSYACSICVENNDIYGLLYEYMISTSSKNTKYVYNIETIPNQDIVTQKSAIQK